MTFNEWLMRQYEAGTVTLEAAWNAGFTAGIESRLNRKDGVIEAAPSQEPLGTVGQLFDERVIAKSGLSEDRLVYLTTPDAAAQIESLKAQLAGAKTMYEAMSDKTDTAAAQIAELESRYAARQRDATYFGQNADYWREQHNQLQEQITIGKTTNHNLHSVIKERDEEIAKLQAENAEWKESSLRWRKECEQLTAAARMALKALVAQAELGVGLKYPVAINALRDALGERHDRV